VVARDTQYEMSDPSPTEFSLSVSPTAEIDALEVFGRILADKTEPLRERAMLLISGLLTSEEGPSVASGEGTVSVKVISGPRWIRVEIKDAGTGAVLEGLRKHRRPASNGWSPHLLSRIADRWGLVSSAEGAWVWFELDHQEGSPPRP
jgi:hypothetical protein